MAKKKAQAIDSNFMTDALREAISESVGLPGNYTLTSNTVIAGIPIPSLALQWLLTSAVWPLSRVIEVTGSEGTCKSTFMFELMRWFLDAGGVVFLLETEAKDSAALRNAILEYKPERIRNVTVIGCASYDKWMKVFNLIISKSKEKYGDNITLPILIVIDSITAVSLQDALDEAEEKGQARSGYPLLAKQLTEDFKTLTDKLLGYPITVSFTNHCKTAMNGLPATTRAGGKALKYTETVSIKFDDMSGAGIRKAPYADGSSYKMLKAKLLKNSMGPQGKEISKICIKYGHYLNPDWVEGSDEPKYLDSTEFDWAMTDLNFLVGKTSPLGKEQMRAVQNIVDLNVADNEQMYWSNVLGVPESNPVHYTEIHKRLFANPELLKAVQLELWIPLNVSYRAGEDYREKMRKRIDELDAKMHRTIVEPKDIEFQIPEVNIEED